MKNFNLTKDIKKTSIFTVIAFKCALALTAFASYCLGNILVRRDVNQCAKKSKEFEAARSTKSELGYKPSTFTPQ